MTVRNVAVVVGVGPGLGSAVALRFAREGYAIALVARGADKLDPVKEAISSNGGRALAFPSDATDPGAVASTFGAVRKELGDPEVLVYNAGAFVMGGIADIAPDQFERAWRGNCFGGFLCAREVVPAMVAAGRGTILFTGATASLRGSARFAGLAVGKFGLRALAQSMARELGPEGVHVAHVIIDGQIATPRQLAMQPDRPRESFLDPDAIAESYWHLHRQDRTSWTQEIDLRPAIEKF